MSDFSCETDDADVSRRALVSAIVITFNPILLTFATILDSLRPQVERIVIVDNGSAPATARALADLAARHDCVFKALGENLGIAAAQNRGVEALAKASDSEFVLFLDHDSVPSPDMVDCLADVDARLRRQGARVGGVGPLIVDKRTGTVGGFVRSRRFWIGRDTCKSGCLEIEVDFLISSGTLIRLDVFRAVGGMNEGLFIDHVDTEWCLRATTRGYRLYGACNARLTHSLGDEVIPLWLGRWREVFVHSPVRDYYMCRNTILILREVEMSLAWRFFLIARLTSSIIFFGVGVAPRGARLRQMGRGLVDGFSGRSGPLSA